MEELRVIISGGGTGGHIFPAIAIANAIRELRPEAKILFVGAQGRMEMQRVPDAGYDIVGLPVAGFDRKRLWRNVGVLFKLARSQWKAWRVIRRFRPQVAVGVGGYASGPTLKMAGMMGIPTLIQEQNSYAGVTNKLLARKARKICVAYEGMEKFFPADKIVLTGNPVRQNLAAQQPRKEEALRTYDLMPGKKTILVLGGSLGARTLNNTLLAGLETVGQHPEIQFIWQTGKHYFREVIRAVDDFAPLHNLRLEEFIKDMATAYSAADLIVSRAGAGSISEFCLLRKPVVLVPSPNVAEDHQTKNALALVDKQAAIYVKDGEAEETLLNTAIDTVTDDAKLAALSENIGKLALPHSALVIAREVLSLAEEKEKGQNKKKA
ncbi:MAG: undecaprenyldiphospho-muramoylpentapeptide beta-N-acetylglucosaminyltransferase [Mediterranea sp.]|jgi:UDP-N-acetylglucosamine--N-acetylmuramyl-(pentapeptide) pyrophosphoryl-undecaprenol N-acetylglucosamine transferase|nr:undecaprenyldiphospho-muramoylpentapeptide beta-N-acetylglucosaminyltransferase [Mediterranea sp.]